MQIANEIRKKLWTKMKIYKNFQLPQGELAASLFTY